MSHPTTPARIVLLPRGIARQGGFLALAARAEARPGKRVTTYQPGRDCHVVRRDSADQKGAYHSAWDAVESLLD